MCAAAVRQYPGIDPAERKYEIDERKSLILSLRPEGPKCEAEGRELSRGFSGRVTVSMDR